MVDIFLSSNKFFSFSLFGFVICWKKTKSTNSYIRTKKTKSENSDIRQDQKCKFGNTDQQDQQDQKYEFEHEDNETHVFIYNQ